MGIRQEPEQFFNLLLSLHETGHDFQVVLLGQQYEKKPAIFERALSTLGDKVLHVGYAKSATEYADWLWRADILPITSLHDFFGISCVEAMYCDVFPLLPNRLAYPEHIPPTLSGQVLYANFQDLHDRLSLLLQQWPCPLPSLRHAVHHYDWTQTAPNFDNHIENI